MPSPVTRRAFLRASGATAAGLAMSSLGSPAPAGAQARRGGRARITYAGAAQPAHLDAHLSSATLVFVASDPMNDWLVRYDQKLQLQPSLASRYEMVDEKTLRFRLRDNLKFHNGRAITSEDVKKTIERIQDPKTASPYRVQLDPVGEVETPDAKTAVFKLKRVYPALLPTLTRIAILPMEAVPDMRTKPVGAGPFRFKEWRTDSYLEYERFDGYWDPSQPRLDGMRWTFLPDYNASKNALLAKELDLMLRLTAVDVKPFQGMAGQGVRVKAFDFPGPAYLATNHAKKPYDNVKVRQAIQLALDKQGFSDAAYLGLAKPSHIPIPRETYYYFDDYAYKRDLGKAKQLLAEAGYPNGFEDTVLIPKTPFEEPYGVVLQSQLQEIGIRLQINVLEPATLVKRTLTDKDYTITMLGDSSLPDPAFLLDRYLLSSGGSNLFNYKNPKMDELLIQAGSINDEAKRKDLYKQAMKLMIDDAAWTIVMQIVLADAWREPLHYDDFWSPTANRYHWGILAMKQ